MPRSDPTIEQDIYAQIMTVDGQMQQLADKAREIGCNPSELKDANGMPLIVPLLQIRSNLVLAEAIMKRKL